MAEKRYYWLKLKEGFFKEKAMKKLRKVAGGDTYTIIYLKMLLLSLQNNGKIYFDSIEDDFSEEIALEIDEEPDNVRFTIMFLEKCGLLSYESPDTIYLNSIEEMIGSESGSARRVRKHRNTKALQCNGDMLQSNDDVTECNKTVTLEKEIEKDIDIDKERIDHPSPEPEQPKPKKPSKHKHGEYKHVLLLDDEYGKLCMEYGEEMTEKAVKFLDEYIEMKGYKAKSHYLCMKKWVFNAVKEREEKQNRQQNYQTKKPAYNDYMKHETPLNQMGDLEKQLLQQTMNRRA